MSPLASTGNRLQQINQQLKDKTRKGDQTIQYMKLKEIPFEHMQIFDKQPSVNTSRVIWKTNENQNCISKHRTMCQTSEPKLRHSFIDKKSTTNLLLLYFNCNYIIYIYGRLKDLQNFTPRYGVHRTTIILFEMNSPNTRSFRS